LLTRLRTVTVLCATATALALTIAAYPAAAGGGLPVSLDTYGSPGPVVGIANPPQLYAATVPVNWWTAVGVAGGFAETGGYSYDYSLTVQPPSGSAVTSAAVELTGQDVANLNLVAVNTNYTGTTCPQLAGSYVATVAGVGPTGGRNTSSPLGYQVWKTFAGQAIVPGTPDHPTIVEVPTDVPDLHPLSMLDVYLQAGKTYEFSYNPYTTDAHGGMWLFASDPNRCVQTIQDAVLSLPAPLHSTELSRQYTAPRAGWYGLGLLTGTGWRFAVYQTT
jgi:hypothetical protein